MHILKWLVVYSIIGWMFRGAFDYEDERPPLTFILIWPVWIVVGLFMILSWLLFKFGEKITKFVYKRRKKIHKKKRKQNERRKRE